MAKLNNKHFLAGCSGRIGDMVLVTNKFGTYIRKNNRKRATENSPAQRAGRNKFSLAAAFVKAAAEVFKAVAPIQSEWFSNGIKFASAAIETLDDAIEVKHEALRLSAGKLRKPNKVHMTFVGGLLRVCWSVKGPKAPGLKAVFVAHLPEPDKWLIAEGSRDAGNLILPLGDDLTGTYLEGHILFKNEDEGRASDSVYLGKVSIGE